MLFSKYAYHPSSTHACTILLFNPNIYIRSSVLLFSISFAPVQVLHSPLISQSFSKLPFHFHFHFIIFQTLFWSGFINYCLEEKKIPNFNKFFHNYDRLLTNLSCCKNLFNWSRYFWSNTIPWNKRHFCNLKKIISKTQF